MKKNKFGLTTQIMIALVAGILFGVICNQFLMQTIAGHVVPLDSTFAKLFFNYVIEGAFDAVGQIFVRSLKMLVVPIVLLSLVCGVCALKDLRKLGRMGGATLFLYILTTCVAITLALGISNIINPGVGFDLSSGSTFEGAAPTSLKDVFVNLVSPNPFQSMVEANMLQLIVFAILFGLAVIKAGEKGKPVLNIFESANEIFMRLIMLLMMIAPFGVFCLIAKVFATMGFSAFEPLLKYTSVVLISLLIHAGVVYPAILKFLSGLNPIQFFRKMEDPLVFAFSTASSNATLPVTLETAEHKLGVDNSIASFTIPLGATMNMDGTAIMQGCATVFIAQAYNVDISLSGYLMVILTATLASIGTAGVPGVGLVLLSMVLTQVGLPIEGIGYILGIDRLLDMCRTAVNVCGDSVVTCVVAKWEGALDEKVFYGKEIDVSDRAR